MGIENMSDFPHEEELEQTIDLDQPLTRRVLAAETDDQKPKAHRRIVLPEADEPRDPLQHARDLFVAGESLDNIADELGHDRIRKTRALIYTGLSRKEKYELEKKRKETLEKIDPTPAQQRKPKVVAAILEGEERNALAERLGISYAQVCKLWSEGATEEQKALVRRRTAQARRATQGETPRPTSGIDSEKESTSPKKEPTKPNFRQEQIIDFYTQTDDEGNPRYKVGEIAKLVGLSPSTVSHHIKRAYESGRLSSRRYKEKPETRAERRTALTLYQMTDEQGNPQFKVSEIAEHLQIPDSVVSRYVVDAEEAGDLDRRRPKTEDERSADQRKARDLYHEKTDDGFIQYTVLQIAQKVGIAQSTASEYLKNEQRTGELRKQTEAEKRKEMEEVVMLHSDYEVAEIAALLEISESKVASYIKRHEHKEERRKQDDERKRKKKQIGILYQKRDPYDKPKYTIAEIAEKLGIGVSQVYTYIEKGNLERRRR